MPTPLQLVALDAVVVDCETTGLDSRSSRVIQLGAVHITGGEVATTRTFDRLINPGLPVPPASTAIHGISDGMLVGQPDFVTVAAEFRLYSGDLIWIGHSIGFDLAMLRREHGLAHLPWTPPRVLDVRVLGRLAAPTLAGHDLDRLCDWLEIEIRGRHTALGDALATAEAFVKLVPLLRERGIRTVAEVEAAALDLAERTARATGGLIAAAAIDAPPATPASPVVARLDAFAYRHRVRDVMSRPARVLPATASLQDATGVLIGEGLSSVFVALDQGRDGIVTERDALRALHRTGGNGGDVALCDIASSPLVSVGEDDLIYTAIGRMARLKVRHLAVRDRSGAIVGALTPKALLRNRATEAIALGDGIQAATSTPDLARCWSEVTGVAASLQADGVDARAIAGVISAEIGAMTARAAELAIQEMADAGEGPPPCRHAVLILGSGGRAESLLAADQDNALVLERGEPGSAEDQWFEAMAIRMNDRLDAAGIVRCKGGVMARNPVWRKSVLGWEATVEGWVRRQKPEDLLNVDIFFDAATVQGAPSLGDDLLVRAGDLASRAPDFLKMLTEVARQWRSPVGLLGGFQKQDGRLDLKKYGLLPIVTGARVLALKHGVRDRGTAARLRALHARGLGQDDTVAQILASHQVLLGHVLAQQLSDGRRGVALATRVDVDRLDPADRRDLKHAFEGVAAMIDWVSEGRV